MQGDRARVLAWLGNDVLPHEAEVRLWLRKSMLARGEVDDVIQEAYCRLAGLEDVRHIGNARAYFFKTARNVVFEQMRRARVVRIETVTEIEALNIAIDEPSPEHIIGARRELARVKRLIDALPDLRRRILRMRKIDGLPQREIARRLGVTENVVENEAVRGLRAILKALAEGEVAMSPSEKIAGEHDRSRKRRRD